MIRSVMIAFLPTLAERGRAATDCRFSLGKYNRGQQLLIDILHKIGWVLWELCQLIY